MNALLLTAALAISSPESDAAACLALARARTPAKSDACACGDSCPCTPGKRGDYCLCEPGACPMVKCDCHKAGGAADPKLCTCPAGDCPCVYGSDCRSYHGEAARPRAGVYRINPDGSLTRLRDATDEEARRGVVKTDTGLPNRSEWTPVTGPAGCASGSCSASGPFIPAAPPAFATPTFAPGAFYGPRTGFRSSGAFCAPGGS